MTRDWLDRTSSWWHITLESVGLGVAGVVVALLLTQSSYEASVIIEPSATTEGGIDGLIRDARDAAERSAAVPVKLSMFALRAGGIRLSCRSEVHRAAREACDHAIRAASERADSVRVTAQLQDASSELYPSYYLLAACPALAWFGLRVRRRGRQREGEAAPVLDGWRKADDNDEDLVRIAPSFPANRQSTRYAESVSPVANQQLSDGQPAETELTTRIVFRVGGNPFSPNSQVLTRDALDQLHELCEQLLTSDAPSTVVRVASSVSSRYAKTQVAVQLATLLAEHAETRVVVVEGDIDAPALHKVMRVEAPAGIGFSEQLQRLSNRAARGTVSVIRVENGLYALLESRVSSPAALGLLQFECVIERLRTEHEFIIVDGPVVDTWPDASHLSRCVDRVVLVAAAGTRLRDTVALGEMHFAPEAVLGIIRAGEWSATG